MSDGNFFRPNIGIIVINDNGKLLLARRCRSEDAWQFPQGGIQQQETPQQAMFRELLEEVGLRPVDVAILAESKQWLTYHLPKRYWRRDQRPLVVGQKQRWFLLRLVSGNDRICLNVSQHPEFDDWRWVDYWYPLEKVIEFKREVYRAALAEFEEIAKGNFGETTE